MKNQMKHWLWCLFIVLFVFACNEDDNEPASGGTMKSYSLTQLDNSGVNGTVTFNKEDDATTRVTIQISGTQAGERHPAHIHGNNASAGGPIVLDLNPVDGATGKSETMVTAFNDGRPVTYGELINYNGHVNVHKSATELSIMIAQGNIGSNVSAPPAGPAPDPSGGY